MNNKNVFWGVLLVVIGALFIFDNIGWFDFSFKALFDMWPALLILWGISMLPIKGGIKTTLSVITVLLAVFIGSTRDYSDHWSTRFNRHMRVNNRDWDDFDKDKESADNVYTYAFTEDYDASIKTAVLNMDIAAGKFRIEDTTSFLIDFDAENNLGQYDKEIMKNGSTTEVYIRLEDGHLRSGTNKNRAYIKLNTEPTWEMKLDVGAADFVADLRDFKVGRVEIDGGASAIKLKIGDKQDETNIDIESGASAVKIYIPESAACEVISNTVLSDLDLNGFVKNGKMYRTLNFEDAKQKIYISLDAAVSALNVIRE
ncbi:MAG: DUF5668 domain-containing protein [Bacteroidales bacterium]|jgi:hypothetical protein|nr:DUF5668 domain-containing protein [Bacteroidales bacterium]